MSLRDDRPVTVTSADRRQHGHELRVRRQRQMGRQQRARLEGSDVDYGALDLILDEVAAGKVVGAISSWCKVNVHLGREGWLTDPDGTSGCDKRTRTRGASATASRSTATTSQTFRPRGSRPTSRGRRATCSPSSMPGSPTLPTSSSAGTTGKSARLLGRYGVSIRTGEDRVRSQDDYDRVMASKYPEGVSNDQDVDSMRRRVGAAGGRRLLRPWQQELRVPGPQQAVVRVHRPRGDPRRRRRQPHQAAPSNYLAMGMCLPNDRGCKDVYFDNCEGECEAASSSTTTVRAACPDFNINPQVRELHEGLQARHEADGGGGDVLAQRADGRRQRGEAHLIALALSASRMIRVGRRRRLEHEYTRRMPDAATFVVRRRRARARAVPAARRARRATPATSGSRRARRCDGRGVCIGRPRKGAPSGGPRTSTRPPASTTARARSAGTDPYNRLYNEKATYDNGQCAVTIIGCLCPRPTTTWKRPTSSHWSVQDLRLHRPPRGQLRRPRHLPSQLLPLVRVPDGVGREGAGRCPPHCPIPRTTIRSPYRADLLRGYRLDRGEHAAFDDANLGGTNVPILAGGRVPRRR